MIEEAHTASLFLNKVSVNMETERARVCENRSVANSGCEPSIVMYLTSNAQIAVQPFVISLTLAIWITANESFEKKPGLKAIHQIKTINELIKHIFFKFDCALNDFNFTAFAFSACAP